MPKARSRCLRRVGPSSSGTSQSRRMAVRAQSRLRKISYPRCSNPPLHCSRPVRLRVAVMTRSNGEPDAAADNAAAVERREAQRPGGEPRKLVTAGRARLGAGLANLLATARTRSRSQGARKGRRSAAPWHLPALHSLPREGEEKRDRGVPAPPPTGLAERWLTHHLPWIAIRKLAPGLEQVRRG